MRSADRVGWLRRRHGHRQRTITTASLGTLVQDGSTLNVNGKTITFKNAALPLAANVPTGSGVSGNLVTDGNGNSTVYLQGGTSPIRSPRSISRPASRLQRTPAVRRH